MQYCMWSRFLPPILITSSKYYHRVSYINYYNFFNGKDYKKGGKIVINEHIVIINDFYSL